MASDFGIQIVSNNSTAALEVYIDDPYLLDSIIELEIRTYAVEEDTWFNTTRV